MRGCSDSERSRLPGSGLDTSQSVVVSDNPHISSPSQQEVAGSALTAEAQRGQMLLWLDKTGQSQEAETDGELSLQETVMQAPLSHGGAQVLTMCKCHILPPLSLGSPRHSSPDLALGA